MKLLLQQKMVKKLFSKILLALLLIVSLNAQDSTTTIRELPLRTALSGGDAFYVMTATDDSYHSLLDSLKTFISDYITGNQNTWTDNQTFEDITQFTAQTTFWNQTDLYGNVYLNAPVELDTDAEFDGDMDFTLDSQFILPQRSTNTTLGSMRLLTDPENGSKVAVGFVTEATNEEYLADRTWVNEWKDTADIGIDLADIKYKPLSVAVTGVDSVLQASGSISVYELAHLDNVNLNIQTQFNRIQDDTTNWKTAYTKRVDTWNYPLYFNSNTASLLYNTTHFTTSSNQLTANQITFASNNGVTGNNVNLGGTLTISTPQDLQTTASPTFDDLTLNGELNQEGIGANTFDGDLETDNYVSQLTGWQISAAGAGDFRELYADEMYVKAFITDISQALAGSDFVTKSVAILSRDFTTPATSSTIYVEDLPGQANTAVFETGDWIRLRIINRTVGIVVSDFWGTVSSYSDLSDGEQSWTLTRQTGTSSQTIYKGAVVLDYGTSGDAVIERTVIGSNAPYGRVATWTSNPYTGGNYEVLVQYGILDGISGLSGAGFYAKDNIYISDVSGGTGIEFVSSTTKSVTSGFSAWNPSNPKLFVGNSNYYLDWNNLSAGVLNMKGSIVITGGSGIGNLTDANLDNIDDGSTYGRILQTDISAGHILLSETVGDLDDVTDGTNYGKVLKTDISSGHILLSETVGDLDDISDGTNYGKILKTDISSGHILLSESVGDLDDIDDGTNYERVAATDISAGHITLVSQQASININSTTFGNSGIQLQYNGGSPRAYIGNGSTQYLQYTGGSLSFSGALSAATGTFAGKITAGTVQIGNDVASYYDGIYMATNDYWLSSGYFKAANGRISFDASGFLIKSSLSGSRIEFSSASGVVMKDDVGTYGSFGTDGDIVAQNVSAFYVSSGNYNTTGNYRKDGTSLAFSISPGNSKYYGTNSGGTIGYYDLPSGGGWSGNATSDLDMNTYDILDAGEITATSVIIDDASTNTTIKLGTNTGEYNELFSRGIGATSNYRDFRIAANAIELRTATIDEGTASALALSINNNQDVVFSNDIILGSPSVVTTSSSTGTAGMISWDASYIYVCIGTNTWKRISLSSF